MPVFFAAGGWANATATVSSSAARVRALVGLAAVVVGGWTAAVVIATVVAGDPGVVGDGARIATQPLWFLAAYLPFAVTGRRLARVASAHIVLAVGASLAFLAVCDLARFAWGAPDWVGWPGFLAAWGVPWLIGGWWRARHVEGTLAETRVGLTLCLAAVAGCIVLVATAGYSAGLIDAAPGARSNTNPPTLYTAMAGLAQAGFFLLAATALDRAGRRWRRFWSRAGEAAVGV